MRATTLLGLAITGALAACANRPESISASYVSHEKYAGLNCEQLKGQMENARRSLQEASDTQNTKANIDAAVVAVFLVPVSKLSGDKSGDIAKWKGEVEAIETAQVRADCKRLT